MKKLTNPFEDVTAAGTSRQKATDYVTPDGKERHVPEKLRNAFDYLITMWDGTKSSFDHTVKVEDWETDLRYLSGRLYYCTDDMPPDVVDLLGRLDINIEEEYAIYGYTYAAAAHALTKKLIDPRTS
jgi:hypothetical protein